MKKMIFLFWLIALACDTPPEETNDNLQQLDFGKFSIEVPVSWKYIPMQGVDSFVGIIETNTHEKISFDYGMYSNTLNVDATTHKVTFAVVDGKGAKIVSPKVSGQGFTGIYFENIKSGSMQEKLTLSALNLTPEAERSFVRAFRTLRFE